MKNILIILFAFIAVSLSAQKILPITSDTAAGSTIYFAPSYSTSFPGISSSEGVVGFFFSKADIADSCNFIKMQGSLDGTNFTDCADATAYLTNTTADGNFYLYITSPKFYKYRLACKANSGDSTRFYNVKFFYNKP